MAVELGRVVERGLRESRAIDTEALCIVAGVKVWSVRVDIHVLDHGGNLTDAASLATVAALLHFRRPDVTVVGDQVTIVCAQFFFFSFLSFLSLFLFLLFSLCVCCLCDVTAFGTRPRTSCAQHTSHSHFRHLWPVC